MLSPILMSWVISYLKKKTYGSKRPLARLVHLFMMWILMLFSIIWDKKANCYSICSFDSGSYRMQSKSIGRSEAIGVSTVYAAD